LSIIKFNQITAVYGGITVIPIPMQLSIAQAAATRAYSTRRLQAIAAAAINRSLFVYSLGHAPL